jgi:hypothetical protein
MWHRVSAQWTKVTCLQPLDDTISVKDMRARHTDECRANQKLLHTDDTFFNRVVLKRKLMQCLNGRLSGRDCVGLPKDCIERGVIMINLYIRSSNHGLAACPWLSPTNSTNDVNHVATRYRSMLIKKRIGSRNVFGNQEITHKRETETKQLIGFRNRGVVLI